MDGGSSIRASAPRQPQPTEGSAPVNDPGVRFGRHVTRLSSYFLPTERDPPADAEAISHKLMVRAGLIRQIGSGLWSWLPAGWRVHQRIVQIVREEMNAIGAQEMLMPVLHPADPWRRSGRYGIDELFKLKDRRGADMVLAMTHEEIVTGHVAAAVRSYRDLPLILYHFQVKERDEPRPRAGVLRTREFIMKDSYTFDRDPDGLDASYQKHVNAYDRMMDRCGLEWYRVEADVGMMGGLGAHEYMAPCPAGENDVVLAPGYAANLEVACADPQPVALPEALGSPETVHTPGMTTVDAVARALEVPHGALLKAFPVVLDDGDWRLIMVRGDHRVNEVKLRTVLAGDTVGGAAIRIEPAIEVGNIFKLGVRYSEPLGARYLDESGSEQLIWMGCYGFGPARAAAAAVEQYADEHGISWPRALAPFDVELVVLGKEGGEERAVAERLYDELQETGLQILYDDRDANTGEQFADAEL